jgi:hypothetical protein
VSNYVKSVDFAAKDALATGNPSKLVRGSEINTEYNNIATAIATKEDTANKGAGNGYAGLDSSARLSKTNQHSATVYTDASNIFTTAQWLQSTSPGLYFVESDATANNTSWRIYNQNEQLAIQLLNDAVSTSANAILIDRTANTVDSIALTATAVTVNGTSVNDTALITSGTFANARISQGSVTQHQAALAIAGSQVTSGTLPDARIAQSGVTQHQAALALATTQITTGTFADARIAASNVTQHQASLSLAASQITSGTLANARVAASNVTQHQSSLALDATQITSGSLPDARVPLSNVSQHQASIKTRNITGKSGTSFTIQSGGTASGGSDGDIIGIY